MNHTFKVGQWVRIVKCIGNNIDHVHHIGKIGNYRADGICNVITKNGQGCSATLVKPYTNKSWLNKRGLDGKFMKKPTLINEKEFVENAKKVREGFEIISITGDYLLPSELTINGVKYTREGV